MIGILSLCCPVDDHSAMATRVLVESMPIFNALHRLTKNSLDSLYSVASTEPEESFNMMISRGSLQVSSGKVSSSKVISLLMALPLVSVMLTV